MQTKNSTLLTCLLALACAAQVAPAWGDSSSVSSATSDSVGSSSTSIEKSSDSISGKRQVAQGDYTVVALQAVPQHPNTVRVQLQAVQGAEAFFLLLPRQTVKLAALAPGQVIAAQQRPYGLALRQAGAASPFFLVLDDDWYRELDSRALAV